MNEGIFAEQASFDEFIGTYLKYAREHSGISYTDMAVELGLSPNGNMLAALEKTGSFTAFQLYKYCNKLVLNPNYIFEEWERYIKEGKR